VIKGLLKPGDHVITSSMEHNSVMRPLRELEQRGIELSVIGCGDSGIIDPDRVRSAIRGNTVLIIITHASNVTGSIQPVDDIGRIAREHGILFCVDSAQTAGALTVDVEAMNIDLLCFSGHKSLLGPMGTGGLYIRKGVEKRVEPLMQGGTGSRSEYELQPEFMPDRYESGTLNALGIAGLLKSVEFILEQKVEHIREKENRLVEQLVSGLSEIKGLTVYGPRSINQRTPAVSFNINGVSPSEAALVFDEEYGIMSRPGLHCAPSAHKTIGTFPAGTNRLSPGFFSTCDEIDAAVKAVHSIAARNK
ncbi:MAG TPA: aminotransferase class V-fold PLP-dependent enzyme, partial [Spirochaetota bacterium]|nr:aminotransferase class V-fold PLP-dependent enzyme [Spirochaetota bacterium]